MIPRPGVLFLLLPSLAACDLAVDGALAPGPALDASAIDATALDGGRDAASDAHGGADASAADDASNAVDAPPPDDASPPPIDAGDDAPPPVDAGCNGVLCGGQCVPDCNGCGAGNVLCASTNTCGDCSQCGDHTIQCFKCDLQRRNPVGTCEQNTGNAFCLSGQYPAGSLHCACQNGDSRTCPGQTQVCLSNGAQDVCYTCGEANGPSTDNQTCGSGMKCHTNGPGSPACR